MARRSTKAKKQAEVKLNWKNPTLEKVTRFFLYSEGRLSKDQIIEIGNQTLFQKLKAGGFIEEVKNADQGIYKTTEKLKNQYKVNIDANARFTGSGSTNHAKGVFNVIKMLPSDIVMNGNIKTEEFLKDEYKNLKRRKPFQTNLANYRDKLNKEKTNLIAQYKKEASSTPRNKQALLKAQYSKDIEKIDYRLKVLGDRKKGISSADFRVIATKNQAEEILKNLQEQRDRFTETYHIDRFDKAINKLQSMILKAEPTKEININFEVITETYEAKDIMAKEHYEITTGEEIIFIPAY